MIEVHLHNTFDVSISFHVIHTFYSRYGHTCLMMELAGVEGILVSGGALTGKHVDFYDIKNRR